MGFEANARRISKLLNDSIYYIPRNQRQYVWTIDNWNDLLSDVRFSTHSDSPHFIGSVVLQKGSEENGLDTFLIIDGQQRMITITVFMLAIMMQLKQCGYTNDSEGMLKFIEATDKKNRKHMILDLEQYPSLERMLQVIKVETSEDLVKLSLSAFINKCTISLEHDKQITDCYKFFYSEIHKEYEQNETIDSIIKLKDALLNMSYVHIEADSEEDSYTVFEILNARGTDLGDSELLKNFIMRYILPERNRDRVKSAWQQMDDLLGKHMNIFIKHYALHYYPTDKQELRQNPYRNIRLNCKKEDVNELLLDITQKANYYYKIINPATSTGERACSEIEKRVFSFFKAHRQEQVRPLLLSLMHQRQKEALSEEGYNNALLFLYRFVICYTVVGEEKSNKIRDIILKYAPKIEHSDSSNNIQELERELRDKIPGEQFFLTAFQNLGYSNHTAIFSTETKKKKVQIVLRLLEEHWGNKNTEIDFTIEHILPDSQSEENARIGNLIPLEKPLNQRCQGKTLQEKQEIYKESMLYSVRRFLQTREKKPDFDLEDRTKRLAKLFYNEILRI